VHQSSGNFQNCRFYSVAHPLRNSHSLVTGVEVRFLYKGTPPTWRKEPQVASSRSLSSSCWAHSHWYVLSTPLLPSRPVHEPTAAHSGLLRRPCDRFRAGRWQLKICSRFVLPSRTPSSGRRCVCVLLASRVPRWDCRRAASQPLAVLAAGVPDATGSAERLRR